MSGNGPDLAVLSLAIDSSEAKAGVTSLKSLEVAAGKTEGATQAMERAWAEMTGQLQTASAAMQTLGTAAADLRSLGAAAKALHDALPDASGFERLSGGVQRLNEQLRRTPSAAPNAEAAIRQVQSASVEASTSADDLTQKLAGVAARLGGLAALGYAAKSAAAEALELSSAMGRVNTVLGAGQAGQLDALTDAAKRMGAEFGSSAASQANALYEILSAGASDATQATNLLTAANKLAVGGVTDVKTAADGLTTVMATYGSQVSGVTAVSDAMFQAAADGKTTVGELSQFIGRVAPIAAQTGVSLDELLAATAALTKGGQETSTSMMGLRAILAQVAKPSQEAAALAAELGIDFNTAGLKAKGLSGFLEDVREKTGGSTEQMALLMGGVEALLPAMTLTGTGAKDFASSLENMKGAAGATETALAKMAETPQYKLNQLRAQLTAVQETVGEGLLDAAMPGVELALRNVDSLTTATGYLAAALGGVLAVRSGQWASEWVRGLGTKLQATTASRAATVEAALAEAGYTRVQGESTRAALANAQAHLAMQRAGIQAALVSRQLTAAEGQAAFAAYQHAKAELERAAALGASTAAGVAAESALALVGGPMGALVLGVTALSAAFDYFSTSADEAREAARRFADETAATSNKATRLVEALAEQTKAAKSEAEATEALALARNKLVALGPQYEEALSGATSADDAIFRVEKQIAAEKKLADERIRSLEAERGYKTSKARARALADGQEPDAEGVDSFLAAPGLKSLNAELNTFRDQSIQAAENLRKLDELHKTLAGSVEGYDESLKKLKEAQGGATEAMAAHGEETDKTAKAAARWLANLEEDSRALGKSKTEARKLSAEYAALTAAQRQSADAAIAHMEAFERAEKAKQQYRQGQEFLKGLEAEAFALSHSKDEVLRRADAERTLTAAQRGRLEVLRSTIAAESLAREGTEVAVRLAGEQVQAAMALHTAREQALESYAQQLDKDGEAAKRMEMLNILMREGRISAEEYGAEVQSLQSQMTDGFSAVHDSVRLVTDGMANAFADFAATGKLSFSDLVSSILADLSRLLAKKAIMQLIDALIPAGGAGGAGGAMDLAGYAGIAVSGMGLPARAAGGPVRAGQAYMVGEAGPEPFIPASNGTILPHGALGGGGPVSVVVNVERDGSASVQSQGGGAADMERLGLHIGNVVRQEMVKQQRPGGLLYPSRS